MGGRFKIETLGCKANTYDTLQLRQALAARGWRPAGRGEAADLVLVNSCTVTDEADRQSRKSARRLARRNPDATVVMTGCGAEVAPEAMAAVEGVDLVVGNQDKPALVDTVLEALDAREDSGGGRVLGGATAYDVMRPRHDPGRQWAALAPAAHLPPDPRTAERTRAFVKVQEGCDAFCTFCVIPYARGPARSLRPGPLVRQVRQVVAAGAREVVLTGTALGDYGVDLIDDGEGVSFEDLVDRLLEETDVPALRLGSLDPVELTPRLLDRIAHHPRVRPHAHVSLQSPHPLILKRMKRRYDGTDVVRTLEALEALGRGVPGGIFVGMDVISGFPGETEAIFEDTVARFEALPWTRLHVFPYSEREGTAATRLGDVVPPDVRRARTRRLIDLSDARLLQRAQRLLDDGGVHQALVEGPGGRDGAVAIGRLSNYFRVRFPAEDPGALRNQEVAVRLLRVEPRPVAGDVVLLGARA